MQPKNLCVASLLHQMRSKTKEYYDMSSQSATVSSYCITT